MIIDIKTPQIMDKIQMVPLSPSSRGSRWSKLYNQPELYCFFFLNGKKLDETKGLLANGLELEEAHTNTNLMWYRSLCNNLVTHDSNKHEA